MFDKTRIKHIENVVSDHSMIFMNSNPQLEKRKRRFLFDRRRLKKEGLEQVIKNAWEEEDQEGSNMYKVTIKVANYRVAIPKWKNKFQGNARQRIDTTKKKLEEVKKSECQDKKERVQELY